MFSIQRVLENEGHKVVPFSINYANNKTSPYAKYFANPPVEQNHVYYQDSELSIAQKLRLFSKTVYNAEAAKKLRIAINEEQIDLVYTLQVVNFLYSAVINQSAKLGIPVISRLSDFQLICPAYTFFRRGMVCEDCKESLFYAVKHRCLQNSLGVSLARVLSMYAHRFLNILEKIDVIIAPSKFLQNKLIEHGVDKEKIVNIPSYIDPDDFKPHYEFKPYVLYIGNLLDYKGVDVLVKAFVQIEPTVELKIVGKTNTLEAEKIINFAKEKGIDNIKFLGFRSGEELKTLYQEAMFVVVPSVCYENMPNVVLEAFAYGKPVLGSKIGSIAELIDDNINGLFFEPAAADDLAEKIHYLINNRDKLPKMGQLAREKVEKEFNPQLHYQKLRSVFQKVKNKDIHK